MKSQIALIVLFLLFAKVEGTAVRGSNAVRGSSECNNYARNNNGPFDDYIGTTREQPEQAWRNALALCTGCLDIKPKSGENEFKGAFGENKKWIGCQWSRGETNYRSTGEKIYPFHEGTKEYHRHYGGVFIPSPSEQGAKRCRMIVMNETSEKGLILPGYVTKKDDCPYMEKFKEARAQKEAAKTRAQKEAKTKSDKKRQEAQKEAKTKSDKKQQEEFVPSKRSCREKFECGDQEEWKKCFKKASLKHHPDKRGDAEEFKKLSWCNEFFKDFQG